MNPYNCYDACHYRYEVSDEMIGIVYGGKENKKFGSFLTKDNIDNYLSERKRAYVNVIEEYKKIGTVELRESDA